jgi:hypothetical protein
MHPTANSVALNLNRSARRVMPGVMLLRSELLSEHAKREALLPRGVAKIENEVEGAA